MAWPPPLPSPVDVANVTPQADRHPGDHNLIADALAVMVGGAWTPLGLGSGWTNFGAPYVNGYRIVGDLVYVRGLVSKATAPAAGETVATFPVGFRPVGSMMWTNAGANGAAIIRYRIDNAGVLSIDGASVGSLAAGWFSITGPPWSVS